MELLNLCQVKDVVASVVQLEASLRRETGLNLNQSFALCCLAKGQLSAGALADELRIHGASLSRIIKALHQKGYIYRELNEVDSRQKVLALTQTGRALAATLASCERTLFPVPVEERGIVETR